MSARSAETARGSCAMTLDLSHGWHPSTVRIEWFEPEPAGDPGEARLELHGWIDRTALERLEAALDDLSQRGVRRLLLDCAHVRHVEFGAVPPLAELLARFAPCGLVVRGLSPHLRDLFRLAGCTDLVPSLLPAGERPAAAFRRAWVA